MKRRRSGQRSGVRRSRVGRSEAIARPGRLPAVRGWRKAIALYNDTVATGDDDRLAITNQALRELSGVNGLIVGDWIKAHASEVISYNSKYGMQNAKDKSKTETYYNKRHGAYKITKILNLINEQFLDGEALKSQQGKG